MNTHKTKISERNYQDFNHSSWGKTTKKGKGYKTEDSGYVKRLRFIFRDGKRISMPYAFLPLITLEADHRLLIKAGQFKVQITGRGLGALEEALSQEVVSAIEESPSPVDDETMRVFIASIEIEENEEKETLE